MDIDLPFNRRVYALVRRIPPGKVSSYGRIAAMLDTPHGARQVGWAMAGVGTVRDSADVPWQRVVNSEGRISNTPPHDEIQRDWLLAEGVEFSATDRLKIANFRAILWTPSPLEVQHILAEAAE
jgi:methylated-DNA-protein-cysteine methyltransferase-like protein